MRYFVLALSFLYGALAHGHKPSFSNGQYKSVDSAWSIQNMATSIVLYHDVTCESDQLWMEFDSVGDEELFVQLGVPVIDRLAGYRPSVAIIADGLPQPDETLPFDLPEGMGGLVYHSDPMDTPDDFYEPFSQTESWILLETTQVIEQAGVGYVVAWVPGNTTGKLWVAVGTVEDFSDVSSTEFGSWLDLTQRYHETGPYSDTEIEEVSCSPLDNTPTAQASSTGCQTTRANPVDVILLVVGLSLPLIRCRNRRRHYRRSQ